MGERGRGGEGVGGGGGGGGDGGGVVAPDRDQALLWLGKAAAAGDEGAREVLQRLKKEDAATAVSSQQAELQLQMHTTGEEGGEKRAE